MVVALAPGKRLLSLWDFAGCADVRLCQSQAFGDIRIRKIGIYGIDRFSQRFAGINESETGRGLHTI